MSGTDERIGGGAVEMLEMLASRAVRAAQPAGTAARQKHEEGKSPLGILPGGPLRALAKVMSFGDSKYSPGSWQVVSPPSRYLDAALRHIYAYLDGEDADPESGESHLAHAATSIVIALWHVQHGRHSRHTHGTNSPSR